jgi:hypothetical protein
MFILYTTVCRNASPVSFSLREGLRQLSEETVTLARKTLIGAKTQGWATTKAISQGIGHRMMRHIVSGAIGLLVATTTVAMAESEQGVVVELYTSQGCSSCPPADDLMGKLVDMPGVIGLALHVDYWDYIGWKDTFGQAKFTERQRNYAHAAGAKTIYTPQMIIDGGARMIGNSPAPVKNAIAAAAKAPQDVTLSLQRQGGKVIISGTTGHALPAGTTVQLVHYVPQQSVAIERGENAGRTITYRNVVTSWQKLGEWSGSAALRMEADAGSGPVVVLVQSEGPREVLAAARLK